MAEKNKSYRIRTNVAESNEDNVGVVNVHLDQTYDMLEILSLKLDQKNEYKYYESDYAVIVGRVVANGGFGVTNAKVSIFIPVEDTDSLKQRLNYNFNSTTEQDNDGVRYNLLPNKVNEACHQDVGTFPSKRYLLDNDDVIETFDKYWKYTTTTNTAGDYMLFGVPTGSQTLHVDLDLSDCGILSQKPTDMVYKGYNLKMFDSPTKFKKSTDLNSLAQIYTQDKGVYAYPYWGETSNNSSDNIAITRCDIQLEYKFEPTCVFIGSVVTDKGNNAIGKNCAGTENVGKMSDMSAGEGSIEMIRKTLDNKVEVYQIQGDRLIDGDGVWCYQIPMNLDYVKTDEFGNFVPTDDPDKGIPTRTRVRFRISLDEQPNDGSARKRCRYLVPNNPRLEDDGFRETLEADYEFGSATREESFVDMFWNKVYTVKNYIPRFQKNSKVTNRKFTGIKLINHYGDNNPMPYNNLGIKLSFMYRLICVIVKVIIYIIYFINLVLSLLAAPFCLLRKILKKVRIKILGICVTCPIVDPIIALCDAMMINCIALSSEFCDDGINQRTYYPGCTGCNWTDNTKPDHDSEQKGSSQEDWTIADNKTDYLFTCVENSLAQENDCTSFNFFNDWVNGVLYMPLWYRKITPKKSFLFGLFKRKAKDQWCDANKSSNGARMFYPCAVQHTKDTNKKYSNYDGKSVMPYKMVDDGCGEKCHETISQIGLNNGVILTRQTMTGSTVYYYKAVEFDDSNVQSWETDGYYENLVDKNGKTIKGEVKLLFATDIVLLGSLNSCDLNGVPQFFKKLDNTTYNLPTDILFTDMVWSNSVDESGNIVVDTDGDPQYQATLNTEMTGCDWGNLNSSDECGSMGDDDDGGLFYSIGCSTIELRPKSCINLKRICEYGVSLDDTKYVPNLTKLSGDASDTSYDLLIPDGFISYDELYNLDERSMFATMNGNKLRTKMNTTNGLKEYDFRYLYPENFDGSLSYIMQRDLGGCQNYTYGKNGNLEEFSEDYYRFRMGDKPYFYDSDHRFPRYENSFYFYFGLKYGKTAIDKFNSQFFAECEDTSEEYNSIAISSTPNSWCAEIKGEYDGNVTIDLTGISTPYDIIVNSDSNSSLGYEIQGLNGEKIVFSLSTIDGFTNVTDDSGNNIALPNGDYTLTVTDSDGNISETSFSMNAKYLSFDLNHVNFLQAENVLKNEYNNGLDADKYTKIAQAGSQLSLYGKSLDITNSTEYYNALRTDNKKEEIGGTITVSNIMYDGDKLMPSDISIKIAPTESDDDYNKNKYPYSNAGNVNTSVSKWDGSDAYMAKVGKGDQRYTITVTQLCDGVESNNSITKTITVANPIPFELFINEVDYNLIKDWELGYNHTSTNRVNTNGKVPKEWLSLSNEDNYKWTESTEYNEMVQKVGKAKTNTELEDILTHYNIDITDDIREKINSDPNGRDSKIADEVIALYKKHIISLAKSAFWLTCPKEEKSINISATTSDFPLSYRVCYQTEEYDNEKEINKLTKEHLVYDETSQIDGVMIPTITTKDSEYYSSSINVPGHEDKLCYGKDNINGWMRKPFFVAVANGKKKTLPFEVGATDDSKPSDNLSKYYGFHLIDKTFTSSLMSWSYIHDIPFFYPIDHKDGKYNKDGLNVTANGLFSGYIYNGIPADESKTNTKFDEQILGNKNILIGTLSNSEDDIPTRRIVRGENKYVKEEKDEKGNVVIVTVEGVQPTYDNFFIEDKTFFTAQYAAVDDKQMEVSITDTNSCSIQENVYGNMNVKLNSASVDNYNGGSILSVNCGVTDTAVMYYMFPAKTWKDDEERKLKDVSSPNYYPLNYFKAITDENGDISYYTINVDDINKWCDNVNLSVDKDGYNIIQESDHLFSFQTTEDDIKEKNKKANLKFTSQIIDPIDSENVEITKNGSGNTGLFSIGSTQGAYYIIAVTENNCRTISPVYDFRHISVSVQLKEDGGNKLIVFKIIEPKERFYIKNYTFEASVTITTSSPFNGSVTVEKIDQDISNPADDGFKSDSDTPEDWLDKHKDDPYKDKTYAFETSTGTGDTKTTNYDIYEYIDDFILTEGVDSSAVGADYVDLPALGTNEEGNPYIGYYYQTTETKGYVTIDLNGQTEDGRQLYIVNEETDEEPDKLQYQLIENKTEEGDFVKYKILTNSVTETEVDPETGQETTVVTDTYATLEYNDGWYKVMTMDENPLIAHYEKEISYIISDSVYKALQKYASNPLIGKTMMQRNVVLEITDVVGLRHICEISKIIK